MRYLCLQNLIFKSSVKVVIILTVLNVVKVVIILTVMNVVPLHLAPAHTGHVRVCV